MSTEEESKQHEQSNSNLLEIPSGKLCSDCHDLKKAAKSLRQMTFSVDDDADSVDLDENKTISSLKPADSVMLTKEHFRKKSEESNAGTDISLTDLDVFSEKKSFENKHEENEKDKAVAFDEKVSLFLFYFYVTSISCFSLLTSLKLTETLSTFLKTMRLVFESFLIHRRQ